MADLHDGGSNSETKLMNFDEDDIRGDNNNDMEQQNTNLAIHKLHPINDINSSSQ